MKRRNFHIRLTITVPVVFTSLALLGMVLCYQVTLYCLTTQRPPLPYLLACGAGMTLLTFSAGLLISRTILRPVEQFIREAEQLPAVLGFEQGKALARDELTRYTAVFNQITDFLSKVDAREHFPEIIGESKVMRGVLRQILKVAPADATVLITGESGTGKEVIAQAIVRHSKRRDKPFIALNCAAIPPGLLESELFGHEKGAFTGATAMKRGKFELADTGTLFLDEIGDMPMETQAKILRALESGTCEHVGGTKTIYFDVRLIAATNKDFHDMIEKGQFREDLFHRLNVFPIHLPPLRKRREDIPLLATYFLEKFAPTLQLSSEAMQLLLGGQWQGNVRELRNAMERAAVLAEEGMILPRHLAGHVAQQAVVTQEDLELNEAINLDGYLEQVERKLIVSALAKTGGVQARAASLLGIKDRSLWHRIRKLGVDVDAIRTAQ
ncbi:sigma-54 interaction domain-containing protein [Megalodesulfovibrio gigas]|uniref:Putative Acetoacetate metabolism regulatory protein atoC n=1 Tax=Megalodesulfovibrio gigas (strain ATCC 19364 / DSM 1382 / NCIMB 9332 / VKM B-1759) TaxID=1121448 RepID=T2G739_MEGG1|nr:sigma-54 dependent transcriptional regulator [Megalodesulfovibrio gigas]AGW12009.1 putative Acetoacetate metabolism regulatory protein atoC [Megalodesulfovibrio gigas DSM 1382 = ATCC 19364]